MREGLKYPILINPKGLVVFIHIYNTDKILFIPIRGKRSLFVAILLLKCMP
jgi:hypothetical protein